MVSQFAQLVIPPAIGGLMALLGVAFGFWLTDWREGRRKKERMVDILRMVKQELEANAMNIEIVERERDNKEKRARTHEETNEAKRITTENRVLSGIICVDVTRAYLSDVADASKEQAAAIYHAYRHSSRFLEQLKESMIRGREVEFVALNRIREVIERPLKVLQDV